MTPGYRIQGEVTIYVDWTEDEESLWSETPEAAIRAMTEWCKDEYGLRGLAPDEYDITLTATANDEAPA